MSVTFTKKHYTCSMCQNTDYELFAIAKTSDISSGYPLSSIPQNIKDDGIYVEILVRDDYGIVITRKVEEKLCSACGQATLIAHKKDNETPVLNFYPQTEAHKWLDGLGKAGL